MHCYITHGGKCRGCFISCKCASLETLLLANDDYLEWSPCTCEKIIPYQDTGSGKKAAFFYIYKVYPAREMRGLVQVLSTIGLAGMRENKIQVSAVSVSWHPPCEFCGEGLFCALVLTELT